MQGTNREMTNNRPPHNPYASAAGAYDKHAQSGAETQRELEARVLLKSSRQMQALQERWDSVTPVELDDVLRYNRQIWLMFVDTAMEDGDPGRSRDLRSNIANLGNFIFKRTHDILAAPEKQKLNILIEINRDIAAGLMTRQAGEKAEDPGTTPAK